MRRYETIVVADPDIPEDERTTLLDRFKGAISQKEGLLITLDLWGTKHLAYEIKKKTRGVYICLDYLGTGALVDEIERFSKIDDRILKFMTIMKKSNVDVEKIKEEIANKAAEQASELKEKGESSSVPIRTDENEPKPETEPPAAPIIEETKSEE
ncbi:MAG: 30S ribosomal protein S6 [Thermodesulfobacteriota bacterium]